MKEGRTVDTEFRRRNRRMDLRTTTEEREFEPSATDELDLVLVMKDIRRTLQDE